jgi:hypothetical protein
MSVDTLDAAPEEKSARRRKTGTDEGGAEAMHNGDGITELEKFDPERVDGVGTPANGFPVLMMKGVPAETAEDEPVGADAEKAEGGKKKMPREDEQGFPGADAEKADSDSDEDDDEEECDDCDEDDSAAKEAESRAAYEAARKEWMSQEPAAKSALTGTEYLQQQAAWKRWYAEGDEEGLNGTSDGYARWVTKQAAPETADEEGAESAGGAGLEADAEAIKATVEAEEPVYKRKIDTETRRKMASEGHALSDGSYPIGNAEDLHNAAVLARSGHGNVAGAKRLIARRASELGVANPLDDSKSEKAKAKPAGGKKPACDTCDGSGKIHDGGMTCPDCKGSGKMKSGAAKEAAALLAVQDEVAKAVANGLINREAAEKILAEVDKARGQRPLPADVKPAAPHREPDGTSTVEQLEPEAGLPTDPDPVADKVPSSVSAMKEIPYSVARMHDATCAAYSADDVLAEYLALKGIPDAIDAGWWRRQALAAAETGEAEKAMALVRLAAAADMVKAADPGAVADGHAFLHKSFTDMYPSEHITPSAPSAPGKFQRPYISAGHASDMASHKGSANIPAGEHVIEPEQFQRGLITAGHESPSPANTADNNRVAPGSPRAARSYYSNAARDQARTALAAMHDHIAGAFPELCSMASSKAVLPPDLGAANVPQAINPPSQGGVTTMKAAEESSEQPAGQLLFGEPVTLTASNISFAKEIRKAVRKALREYGVDSPAAANGSLDTAALGVLLAEQIAPLTEKYDTQLAELRKEIGELGSQPDPALAPLRGAIARAAGPAVPVERRSLVDEARQSEMQKAAAEQAAYREYVTALSRSPDPGTREKALSVLDQMSAAA